MNLGITRRLWIALGALVTTAWLGGCAIPSSSFLQERPPIVFVHGDSDTAGVWMSTIWRFESNGWPSDRLYATDLPYPTARADDTKPEDGRTSTAEHRAYIAAEVDKVLAVTGARQVVLFGLSRGGYGIRDYIAHGGASKVSTVVLGGTPNHGVYADAAQRLGSEYNGAGPFLVGLNAPSGSAGNEVTPGVRWMTIRSDSQDKYAQSDAFALGRPGAPTGVTAEGPALKGAENVVIAGIDHRGSALSPQAFAEAYRFITGKPAATLAVVPASHVVLDGKVSGYGFENAKGTSPSNLPLVGAHLEIFAVNPATGGRLGPAVHRKTNGVDGRWGPFAADGSARYEFVISAPGYATTHIYRQPFPRSSNVVSLRTERLAEADKTAVAVVTFTRPAGYFGIPRDRIALDGTSPPAGVPSGVPLQSTAKVRIADTPGRAVIGEFNGERLVGRAWPAAENNLVMLELSD